MRFALLLLLAFSAAKADPVADLLSTLSTLHASTPVRARLNHHFTNQSGEGQDSKLDEGGVVLEAEEGPAGLTMRWTQDQFVSVSEEDKSKASAQSKPASAHPALGSINAGNLHDYLNASASIEKRLKGAQLLQDSADTWQGGPARLLTLKLDPHLTPRERKYIKNIDTTARIWLGTDGIPVAADFNLNIKGRILLVITFESTEKEQFRFSRIGDRLVVTYHSRQGGGSGGGEQGHQQSATDISILP